MHLHLAVHNLKIIMSRLITSLRFLLAGIALLFAAASTSRAQGYYGDDGYGGGGSYQQFYDELSPYGQWVNDPQYGYVWVPDAGDDFRPYYSNGYWVNSDYGNTWVSNYSWGWAPFHYGRWTYSNYYGWLWVPGNVWGPAWVSWRSGGGAYGWAPLGPGISINVAIGGYSCPDYWWTFTPQQYVLSPRFHQYCYGPRYAPQYVHQTTIINNTYVYNNNTYIGGPQRRDLERAIGRSVQPVAINNAARPMRSEIRGNTVSMFRPAIAENRPRASERPRSFVPAERPVSETATRMPRQASGGFENNNRPSGFRNQANGVQQSAPAQSAEPARNVWGRRPEEPRQERPRLDPVMQVPQQQPSRGFDRQPQATQQAPRGWNNNVARMPERAPVQQQEQRIERPAPFNRGAEMQQHQPQMQRPQESPRPQEAQRPQFQQRSMDRPVMQDRPQPVQRMEQPRMEVPRQAPTQAPAPARMDRPQMNGGPGRRTF
jgi:hypothetical protein